MKFSKIDVQMMNSAGLLHDMGKLAIPIGILEKKGPLSPYEFNIMKQHPFHSYRIIDRIPQMETINEWVSYHHEKIDGSGYPFGLKKKELSPGSRIMAVSDVFTALTEPRPYRQAMAVRDAMDIMTGMVKDKHLDGDTFAVLKTNIVEINELKIKAQNNMLTRHKELTV